MSFSHPGSEMCRFHHRPRCSSPSLDSYRVATRKNRQIMFSFLPSPCLGVRPEQKGSVSEGVGVNQYEHQRGGFSRTSLIVPDVQCTVIRTLGKYVTKHSTPSAQKDQAPDLAYDAHAVPLSKQIYRVSALLLFSQAKILLPSRINHE